MIPVLRLACAMLMTSATVAEEEKTKQERSDELVSRLEAIRNEYASLSRACYGVSCCCSGLVDDQGNLTANIPNPPDYRACQGMDLVKRKYAGVWKELLRSTGAE